MSPSSSPLGQFVHMLRRVELATVLVAVVVGTQLISASPTHSRRQRALPPSASGITNCSGCAQLEEMRLMRIEQIKRELLDKLGLKQPPKGITRQSLTNLPPNIADNNPTLKQLIRKEKLLQRSGRTGRQLNDANLFGEDDDDNHQNDDDLDDEREKVFETAFIFGKRPAGSTDASLRAVHFDFSHKLVNREINEIKLNVPIRPLADESGVAKLIVIVHKLLRDNRTLFLKRHVVEKHHLSHRRYVSMPLPVDDVRPWIESQTEQSANRSKNDDWIGLYVEAMYDGQNLAIHPQDDDSQDNLMYVEVRTVERLAGPRNKRGLHGQHKCSADYNNEGRCCLWDLNINFKDAGWDFILAPTEYNAHMCNGACSSAGPHPQPHANLVSKTGVVTPCCHPIEYDEISLVYQLANNEVLVRKVPNMIARRCGCA